MSERLSNLLRRRRVGGLWVRAALRRRQLPHRQLWLGERVETVVCADCRRKRADEMYMAPGLPRMRLGHIGCGVMGPGDSQVRCARFGLLVPACNATPGTDAEQRCGERIGEQPKNFPSTTIATPPSATDATA